MKSLFIVFVIISIFAACNPKPSETGKNVVGLDSTGLYKNNTLADTARLVATPGSTTKRIVETRSPDGSVTTTTTTTANNKSAIPKADKSSNTSTGITQANNTTAASAPAAVPVQKKGWSSRAKDAAIGGVGGAVAGAIISKKKGKGALIGGAVGAAGGYILGNEKDKKTGR